ncbi:MAG: hypothetical protein IIY70_01215, partial [Oscillospiraceae bacterium]|nr:hypothetical protein [Oscillospiraceae bacterium]
LESTYFGKGYFRTYDGYSVYTNEEYLALLQQEAELLSEYRALTAELSVNYQGQTKLLEEWMLNASEADYYGVLDAFFDQYHASIGNLYVRLVKLRQQLAAALDFDSYAEYSFACDYARDFSPAEAARFLEEIRSELPSLLDAVYKKAPLLTEPHYPDTRAETLLSMLGSAAEQLGGPTQDAFHFLKAYELYDLSPSSKKLDASFETYLYDYEAPFLFVKTSEENSDFQTLCHEFGHFVDSFYNYDADGDCETLEIFSQAMEFLAPYRSSFLSKRQKKQFLRFYLREQLETFLYQGAYADFEMQVYELDPKDVTLDRIDSIFLQCVETYGISDPEFASYNAMNWIQSYHFFEAPFYVISYCVSAQPSLELCRMETEEAGAGTAAYFRLLDRAPGAGLSEVLEEAGLDSPFRRSSLQQTATFIREHFGLDE